MQSLKSLVLFLSLITLAGCLPSSCQRPTSKALLPADSLSRGVAEALPLDTLQLLHRTSGTEAHPLAYPRTLRYDDDGSGRLYVSDVERNSLFVFEQDGAFVEEVAADTFDVPYLAGQRGDTLVVFAPKARRFDFVVDGRVARSVVAELTLPEQALVYAAVSPRALYLKAVGEDVESAIYRLGEDGRTAERHLLPGPDWRYAGFLRPWGDNLLSLSGFRPIVDILTPGGTLDSLVLSGFDSPMLSRTRAFLQGDVHEAPLLTPTATPAGDFLFVLNLRPGWLQVDAYDRQGHLRHRFIEPDPGFGKNYWPQDLAVHPRPDGTFDLAVVSTQPGPALTFYRTSVLTEEGEAAGGNEGLADSTDQVQPAR